MRKLKHDEIVRPDPERLKTLPRHPVSVVLDNIRSLHNVGSIFRTSDAALVEHLYLTGITATPEHTGIHKTALGSQDHMPWSYERDVMATITQLRSGGYTIAVLELTDSPSDPAELQQVHFPLALVVGNEITGVNDEIVSIADMAIEIPQFGMKQSLNVSVAYGIAIFDIVRRYQALVADR